MAVEPIIIGRDRTDLKAYGSAGTALIGKHLVGKGEESYVMNVLGISQTVQETQNWDTMMSLLTCKDSNQKWQDIFGE